MQFHLTSDRKQIATTWGLGKAWKRGVTKGREKTWGWWIYFTCVCGHWWLQKGIHMSKMIKLYIYINYIKKVIKRLLNVSFNPIIWLLRVHFIKTIAYEYRDIWIRVCIIAEFGTKRLKTILIINKRISKQIMAHL